MTEYKALIQSVVYICLLIGNLATGYDEVEKSLTNSLEEDIKYFFKTGIIRANIKQVSEELNLGDALSRANDEEWTDRKGFLLCQICSIIVNQILDVEDFDSFADKMITLCTTFKLGTQSVCQGMVDENKRELLYILRNTPGTNGQDICGVVLFSKGCRSDNENRTFEVKLPEVPKPSINEPLFPESPKSTLKILHLSDTHYDSKYLPGSPADCDEIYLCCRTTSSDERNISRIAEQWGTYAKCDIPKWTLEALYKHIQETHEDIDMIFWTGDIAPHNIWDISKREILHSLREMATLIQEAFPGTPVFPAVGNHEASPVNLFPQPFITDPEFEITWLYEELSELWKQWLPEEAAIAAVSRGGFYSTLARPGLRVISVNTNFCYSLNMWLILDSTDIHNELHLMAVELQKAEDAGDKVYIIGHISPGFKGCLPEWSSAFNEIVYRYESTISGLFFGHTHDDHFELFIDPNNSSRLYEVAYIAQSQTTYQDSNPGYKIYTVEGNFDGSLHRVLDHSNWIMDLDKSNSIGEPQFYELYKAKKDYGLQDLSPKSWYNFVLKMNKDKNEFDRFYRNFHKASPSTQKCNKRCKHDILCELLISNTSDRSHCKALK